MSIRERMLRLRDWLRQLFRRPPPAPRPGYFEAGSKWSWRGWLAHAPWVAPSRDYLVYVPDNYMPRRAYALVVWLHGCRQTPEDFAAGSGIVGEANARDVLVLLPRQTRSANPDGCWNWFDPPTAAGYGEAAIVLAQIVDVRRHFRVDKRRIALAGMSSGGALAAILAVRYPERFAAVAIHSGVPCGAASSAWTAQEAMRSGPNRQVERIALAARHRAPESALPLPALVLHGSADERVHRRNAQRLVTQFLALNGDARAFAADSALPAADDIERVDGRGGGRSYEVHRYLTAHRETVRYIGIEELAHAWSGGDEAYSFHDAHGPHATTLIFDFFAERLVAKSVLPFLSRWFKR